MSAAGTAHAEGVPAPRIPGGEGRGTGEVPGRIERIQRAIGASPVQLCPERADLITAYAREHDDPSLPLPVRKARALEYLLTRKAVRIWPDELIVGNPGTHRRSCILQPELASPYMSQEILWIDRRRTTPMQASWKDKLRLATRVLPYWLRNAMPSRMFPDLLARFRYIAHQLHPTYYLINEAGGIGHFLPDYAGMIRLGTRGYRKALQGRDDDLCEAGRIVCNALERWSGRIADHAEARARDAGTPAGRREELREIARICRKVPARPAETFHEAVQCLWITHLGVNLESINSAVSLGRMDQYLYPYYARDLAEGRITPERAVELLLCFSAKATEHVFLLSEEISEYLGGYLVVQAAVVGGTDEAGNDAVNPLSYLMLDVMERHRLRDPNYQVRLHKDTPAAFVTRALEVARQGFGVPALFNDEAVVPSLTAHGIPREDARDYGVVECVEPSIPGRSFFSTDAALFNLPICLELALNEGRQWNGEKRVGAVTTDAAGFRSMEDVLRALRTQMDFMVERLLEDLQMVERGNREHHPTPLSSLLVEGCMETGRDLTAGGARYNASGLQGVGVADVADSLTALDLAVFRKGRRRMDEVLEALRADFEGHEALRVEMERLPKYGNDEALPDRYADLVVRMFHDSLARQRSTRGGRYVPGFYSVTCHVAFGNRTGALPSGRRAGEPFGCGMGPSVGADRCGPTALLSPVASVDATRMPNGSTLNLRFDPVHVAGEKGLNTLTGLVRGYFDRGGMQLQLNVLDPELLEDARNHPGKHPWLVVRVAGYCAYFDDLPESSKDEIIDRTRLRPE